MHILPTYWEDNHEKTDLLKQDGVFVCQSCGCKYTVEEAKKMMVEGTVDVTGSTVKVDNTDKLNKLLVLATRARKEDNTEGKEITDLIEKRRGEYQKA